MRLLIILLLTIPLCLAHNDKLCAQTSQIQSLPNLHFRQVSTNDGLTQDEIHALFYDKRGFMWIGAFNGLFRYDGQRLYPMNGLDSTTRTGIEAGIPDDLLIDHQGHLWVTTDYKGVYEYNPQTQEHTRYLVPKGEDNADCYVGQLIEDKDGRIFWATNKGLWIRSADGKLLTRVLDNTNVVGLYLDGLNTLWIGTQGRGVWQLKSGEHLSQVQALNALSNSMVNTFANTPDGTLWIGTTAGLWHWRSDSGELGQYLPDASPYSLPTANIKTLLLDHNQRLWIGTTRGLSFYQAEDKRFFTYHHQPGVGASLCNDHILDLTEDRNGNIWVATYMGGVSWFTANFDPFDTHLKENTPSLPTNDFHTIKTLPNGQIYLANGQYLCTFEGQNKTFKTLPIPANLNISRLLHDSNGELLLATAKGLYHYRNGQTPTPVFTQLPVGIPYENLSCVLHDTDNSWWWGTSGQGLIHYFPSQNRYEQFKSNAADSFALAHNYVCQLLRDPQGGIWVTSFDGVQHYDANTKHWLSFRQLLPKVYYGDSGNSTVSAYTDAQGNFWLGRWEGGLDVYNALTKQYRHIDKQDGLPSRSVTGVCSDTKGNIWAATTQGLVRMSAEGNWFDTNKPIQIKVYTKQDGLPSNHVTAGAGTMTPQGYCLLFMTDEGCFSFYPDHLPFNAQAPQMAITGMTIYGKAAQFNFDWTDLSQVNLRYNENFFDIHFTGLSFVQPERLTYAYQLEGFDKDWVYNGTLNVAHYTNVPPGQYLFRLKAANNDGIWTTQDLCLQIIIHPAFWQTRWFYALLIGGFLVLTWWLLRRRERRLLSEATTKADYERQMTELRLSALRAQMNPHFIFNSLNAINRFILKNDSDSASDYLSMFASLIRRILDNSRSERITLEQELETLQTYIKLEELRLARPFSYKLRLDPHLEPMHLDVPPMIIQPYVENAIWHGLVHQKQHTELYLSIQISFNNDILEVIVEDNGIGRVKAAELQAAQRRKHHSHGLQVTSERLELMNRERFYKAETEIIDLYDEKTQESAGTRVILRMKIT